MLRSSRIGLGGGVYHVVNRADGYFTAEGEKAKEIAGNYWRCAAGAKPQAGAKAARGAGRRGEPGTREYARPSAWGGMTTITGGERLRL